MRRRAMLEAPSHRLLRASFPRRLVLLAMALWILPPSTAVLATLPGPAAANPDSIATLEGAAVTFDPLQNDNGPLAASTLSIVIPPQHGAAGAVASISLAIASTPALGDGFWLLVRAVNGCGAGSYDSGGPAQATPRDPGMAASPGACP